MHLANGWGVARNIAGPFDEDADNKCPVKLVMLAVGIAGTVIFGIISAITVFIRLSEPRGESWMVCLVLATGAFSPYLIMWKLGVIEQLLIDINETLKGQQAN